MRRHPQHPEEQTEQRGDRQRQPHRKRTAQQLGGRRRQTGSGKHPNHAEPRPGLEKSHRKQHRR
eukprot:4696533-Alexandrium_andersonii.AAC.1